jgi:hypothetical protein
MPLKVFNQGANPVAAPTHGFAPPMPMTMPILQTALTPQNFSGYNNTTISTWLQCYDLISDHNGWDENRCLQNLPLFLNGSAQRWWEQNHHRSFTYPTLKAALLHHFGTMDDHTGLLQRLISHQQRLDENISSYVLELQDLAQKITLPLTPNFIADQLVAGSHDYIQHTLAGQCFNNAEEFLTAARQIEMVEKHIGTQQEEQAKVQTAMLMNKAQEIEQRHFLEMMESLHNTINELAAQV